MATLATRSFVQLVRCWAAAAQGASTQALDFSVGSVNLALAEAGAAIGLWLQKLALTILGQTRAATSQGADLDSWMADWNFARLPAVAATGQVTFARVNTALQAVVPVGQPVQSSDGSQSFQVTLDPANTAYDAALGGYVLPPGTGSVTVPAQALTAGTAGNVGAGAIGVLVAAIPGIDTVTNIAVFQNGLAAESDAAFRARFPLYLAGLASANKAAIEAAIAGVSQGLRYLLIEQQQLYYQGSAALDANGFADLPGTLSFPTLVFTPGDVLVIVDDGSGAPPLSLIGAVAAAIDRVRGFTTRYQVYAPVIVPADVAVTIATDPAANHAAVAGQVAAGIAGFINALPLGTATLPLTRLAQIAYDAAPGVTNVTGLQINGQPADLVLSVFQVAKAGGVTVN
jgi:hypothetical protein